jgi:ABC-type ATPase with predicted acetyltransferase domain
MKKLLLLAITIMVVLTIPSLCMAQKKVLPKCYEITQNVYIFASPYDAYRWATSDNKEVAWNVFRKLEENKKVTFGGKGFKVYKIKTKHFSVGRSMHELAYFGTKKSIGWISMLDFKEHLKPCK